MCTFLDTIVEDPSYAAYIMSWGDIKRCKQYKDCKVKVIDEVLDESPGGGWTFPKKSEFHFFQKTPKTVLPINWRPNIVQKSFRIQNKRQTGYICHVHHPRQNN